MRTLLLLICGIIASAVDAYAAQPVSVYIAPRASLVPASGRVVFDVYWFNRSERPATIPSLGSYGFTIVVVSRSQTRLPRVLGGAVTSSHRSPDRPIAARTVLRDEVTQEIEIFPDEFVEVTAEFWGDRRRTFKSNTVVLVKSRWPKQTAQEPNQAMERTATHRAFASCVARTSPLRITRALGGRRSSYSR